MVDLENNKKDNKWTYWSNKGQKIEEVNYNNGIHNGAHIQWFDDKSDQHKKFHVNYKDGKKDGTWKSWIPEYDEIGLK